MVPSPRRRFNHEGCRDFITFELGIRCAIPKLFRYDEGMHEVRTRMMLRYGDANLGRALGVFYDILEKDDASGLGDDGDIWRSWRHSHRHQHDDLSNPGTPQHPNMVIPPIERPQHDRAMQDKSSSTCRSPQISPETPSTGLSANTASSQFAIRPDYETRVHQANQSRVVTDEVPGHHSSQHVSKSPYKPKIVFRSRGGVFRSMRRKVSAVLHGKGKDKSARSALAQRRNANPPFLNLDGMLDKRLEAFKTEIVSALSCYMRALPIDSTSTCAANDNSSSVRDQFPPLSIEKTNDPSVNKTIKARSVVCNFCFGTTSYSGTEVAEDFYCLYCASLSKKEQFRMLAGLGTSEAQNCSQLHLKFDTLDPEKFNPLNSSSLDPTMGEASNHYLSIANMNPFRDNRNQKHGVIFEDDKSNRFITKHDTQESGMSESRRKPTGLFRSNSESNFTPKTTQDIIKPSPFTIPYHQNAGAYSMIGEGPCSPHQSPVRGRANSRTPSPIKQLQDVEEDETLDFPPTPTRRGRSPMKKVMFGENGWLGRSTSMKELPSEKYRKTGLKNWGGKLKQRVEEMTEDVSKKIVNPFLPQESPSKSPSVPKFPVSLDPPAQAKLYSEVELMICVTANQYLMIQHREGRMSVESLVKITNFWHSKNRPQVIEFQFDQSTQRDLVLYNLKTFRFYGPNAENAVSLNAMMQAWKAVAKEMSIRTFCSPDSVIRKHMHDCYKILEMMGAPMVTFFAFQEIQIKALEIMRQEQKKRDEYESIKFGVERKWEPPARVTAHGNDHGKELINPFAG